MSEPVSSPAAEEVVTGAETAVAPGATDGQPGTPAQPASPPPPPPPPARNPWLRQMALNANLSVEQVDATASDDELQRLVTVAATLQAGRQAPAQPVQTPMTPAAPVADEIQFALPPEIAQELEDINPAVHKAFQHVGREAARAQAEAKAAKAELDRVNASRRAAEFENTVHDIMNGYDILGKKKPAPGSPEAFRRGALINQLSQLDQAGQLRGMTAEQAIDMAVKVMFGGSSPPPASPPPPPAPAGGRLPSITNPPTHRRGAEEEEDLTELWRKKIEENDRAYYEKEKAAGRNGEFRP
jgi:hypothetical protein